MLRNSRWPPDQQTGISAWPIWRLPHMSVAETRAAFSASSLEMATNLPGATRTRFMPEPSSAGTLRHRRTPPELLVAPVLAGPFTQTYLAATAPMPTKLASYARTLTQ